MSLLAAYGWHARQLAYPLLRLSLFKVRTFRVSVVGGFVTRLGIGGMPFLLPLLYQLGLGLPPWESGLLMMPTAAAAMGMKFLSASILRRYGFRQMLIVNTVHARADDLPVLAGDAGHAAGDDRAARPGAGILQLAAVLEHEFDGLRGHRARRVEHGHLDRQHLPADVAELRAGVRLAHRRLVSWATCRKPIRLAVTQRAALHVPDGRRLDDAVVALVLDPAPGRRRQRQSRQASRSDVIF